MYSVFVHGNFPEPLIVKEMFMPCGVTVFCKKVIVIL
jgi:hypothetical protein